MSTKNTARVGIALAALLLVTFAFVAAPKAPAAAPVAVKFVSVSSAYAAEEAATPAEGEAAKGEAEIPHTTGNLTEQQKADLSSAWEGMTGYNLLIVSILSLVVMVGVVGFAVVKQARV